MANFFIPVKKDGKILGSQKISIDENLSKVISISSKEPNSPNIKVDIENKVLYVECPPNSASLSAISSIKGVTEYKTSDGNFIFPIKSVIMDGKENFSFEIDGFNYTFNIEANGFTITDSTRHTTEISVLSTNLFDVTLSQDIFTILNFEKAHQNLPQINTKNLPIQLFDYIQSTPKLLSDPYNASALQVKNIKLLKINGEILIARGNTFTPIADSKKTNLSTFFAEGDSGYIAVFGMSMNSTGNLVDAVGVKNLSKEEITQIQAFLGHNGKILTSTEFKNLKIHPKNLVVYKQTTKDYKQETTTEQIKQSFVSQKEQSEDEQQEPSPLPIPATNPTHTTHSSPLPTVARTSSFAPKNEDDNTSDSPVPSEPRPSIPPEFNGSQQETFNEDNGTEQVQTRQEAKQEEQQPDNGDRKHNKETGQVPSSQSEQSSTQSQPAKQNDSSNKKSSNKSREQALKITGSLTKLLGFALVMMSLGPASYALCAVGFFLFFSGYVSTDVVDIVEAIINFSKNKAKRKTNRPRVNQKSQENTVNRNKDKTKEQVEEQEQVQEQAVQPYNEQEAQNTQDLLTSGKNLKTKTVDDYLLNKNGEEIFDSETKELFGQIKEQNDDLRERTNSTIHKCSEVVSECENELIAKKKELKKQIEQYNTLSQSESQEDRDLAEKIKGQIVEQRNQILNAEQVLQEEKEALKTTIKKDLPEVGNSIKKLVENAEDLIVDINLQENELIKNDGDFSYSEEAHNENNKKRQKAREQTETANREILEQEVLQEEETKIEEEKQIETRQQIAENKKVLKEKLQEIVTEQKRVLAESQGPYKKMLSSIERIKSAFSAFTQSQNQNKEQDSTY